MRVEGADTKNNDVVVNLKNINMPFLNVVAEKMI